MHNLSRGVLLGLALSLAALGECPSEVVTLSGSEFSILEITRKAREVLKRVPASSFLLVDFRMVNHPTELGGSGDGFKTWIDARRRYMRGYRRAELLVTGVGAVLRVRLAAGDTKTFVLRGQNPLALTVDGRAFEVLGLNPPWKAYVVGPIGSTGESVRVAELVNARFPCAFQSIHIRATPWFVPSLSKLFPFLPDARSPEYSEWLKEVEVLCREEEGGYSCSQATGAELEPRETVPRAKPEIPRTPVVEQPPAVR